MSKTRRLRRALALSRRTALGVALVAAFFLVTAGCKSSSGHHAKGDGGTAPRPESVNPVKQNLDTGLRLEKEGNLEGAKDAYQAARGLAPENPDVRSACQRLADAFVTRGNDKRGKNDLAGALKDYEQAILLDPGAPAIYYHRGIAHHKKGDSKAALADYNQAIRLDPAYAQAYVNRGILRKDAGDLQGADADYHMAKKCNPKLPEVYVNHGNLRIERGDLDGAIAEFTKAIELNPNVPESYVDRGLAHEKKQQLKEAKADYEQALKIAPATWAPRKSVEGRIKGLGAKPPEKPGEKPAEKPAEQPGENK